MAVTKDGLYHKCWRDPQNSTTTPLGISETWTGTATENNHPDVMVSCKTDADGTLYVDFSTDDGVNWDTQIPFAVRAGTGEFHTLVKGNRACRVRFVNGTTAQTYFRLQTDFGTFRQASKGLASTLSRDDDAIAVRITDFHDEVEIGLRSGIRHFNKFGYNSSVDSAAEETVWAAGGVYQIPTTARTITISSTSASDDVGGAGASYVYIEGLDANFKYQAENVAINGTTGTLTTSTWMGINRMSVSLFDGATTNAGIITAVSTTDAYTLAYIPVGEGVTQQCIYHVQDNAKAIAKGMFLNVRKLAGGSAPRVTIRGITYSHVSGGYYNVFEWNVDTGIENTLSLQPNISFRFNDTDVFQLRATTNVDSTVVSARFDLLEYENDDTP